MGPRGPSGPLGTVGVNADGDSEWMAISSGWRLREDMGPRGPFKGGAGGAGGREEGGVGKGPLE